MTAILSPAAIITSVDGGAAADALADLYEQILADNTRGTADHWGTMLAARALEEGNARKAALLVAFAVRGLHAGGRSSTMPQVTPTDAVLTGGDLVDHVAGLHAGVLTAAASIWDQVNGQNSREPLSPSEFPTAPSNAVALVVAAITGLN